MASPSFGKSGAELAVVSCHICRKRKVKCDRTLGGCHRCRRFGEECVYGSGSTSDSSHVTSSRSSGILTTQAGLKRRRVLRSCNHCKRAKAKCSGDTICAQCTRKELECSYDELTQVSPVEPPPRLIAPSPIIPAWLVATELPPIDQLRKLVDIYFLQIHTVRCMGFLHIPTFMDRFTNPERLYLEQSGLIYAMCALAAPFYYADTIGAGVENHQSNTQFFDAGKGWAEAAREHLFSNFGQPGIEYLMTEVLLHEHYLRIGDYAKGFMISGQIARHLQILQLNIENDSDILCRKTSTVCASKETRRRLVWACYLLDALIECGIDQLRLIVPEDIHVQLPCLEELFVRNTPRITEMLAEGKLLPFIDPTLSTETSANLDMRSFYIRAMAIRSKLLKFVKHLDNEVPWEISDSSKFSRLDKELRNMENSIPEYLKMSTENMYLFKASGRLNLYFGLHILMSQNFHDLYRIGVSHLVFPNTATQWIRENAPEEFIRQCHHMCASKSVYIASILKDLWTCHKPSIIDTPYAMHIQVCSSVLVTTLTSWSFHSFHGPLLPEFGYCDYQEMLQNNVTMLQYLQRYIKADMYCGSATQALRRFKKLFSADPSTTIRGSSINDTDANKRAGYSTQLPLEHVLNPLGTYPMARKQTQIQDKPGADATEDIPVEEPDQARSLNSIAVDIEEFPSSDYMFPSHLLDWESEISIMSSMGYPTFLENLSVEL